MGTLSVLLALWCSASLARSRRSPGSMRSKIAACDNTAASLVAPNARGNGIGLVTLLYGIVAPLGPQLSLVHKMLTARAARSAMISSESNDCSIIRIFAHRASAGASVGEKAVLVLKAKNK